MRLAITICLFLLGIDTEPRARSFHFEDTGALKGLPPGARQAEFWMPLPHDDDYQTIRNLRASMPCGKNICSRDWPVPGD
jgi:hypothetical protein